MEIIFGVGFMIGRTVEVIYIAPKGLDTTIYIYIHYIYIHNSCNVISYYILHLIIKFIIVLIYNILILNRQKNFKYFHLI